MPKGEVMIAVQSGTLLRALGVLLKKGSFYPQRRALLRSISGDQEEESPVSDQPRDSHLRASFPLNKAFASEKPLFSGVAACVCEPPAFFELPRIISDTGPEGPALDG